MFFCVCVCIFVCAFYVIALRRHDGRICSCITPVCTCVCLCVQAIAAAGDDHPLTLADATEQLVRRRALILDIQNDLKEALSAHTQQRIQLTELLRRHAWMQESGARRRRARGSGGDSGGGGGGARASRSDGDDGGGSIPDHDDEFMSLPSDDDGDDDDGGGAADAAAGRGSSSAAGAGTGGGRAPGGAVDSHRCVSDVMVTFAVGPTGLALAPTPKGVGYAVEIEYFPLVRVLLRDEGTAGIS